MTDPTTIPPKQNVYAPKQCGWFDCAQDHGHGVGIFVPTSRAQKYCSPDCALLGALEKAEQRKARTGKSSGLGEIAMRKNMRDAAAAVVAKVDQGESVRRAISSLTPEQQAVMRRVGEIHIRRVPTVEEREQYIEALRELPDASFAAHKATGIHGMAPAFRGLAQKDEVFAARVRDALETNGTPIMKAMFEEAVEGVQEPIVSMGQVVTHVRRRDPKLLAMLARQYSKELAAANSSGNGTSVNVQINNTGMVADADNPNNPSARIFLSETWALSKEDRDHLMRIYSLILQRREKAAAAPTLNWEPPGELVALKAAENPETVEVPNDEQ